MALQLVKDEDLQAVAAYVASMPVVKPEPTLEGGDAARGSELFKVCATCHGVDGKGNEQLFGPPLNHASDWYLFAQLEKFRSGVRGADPRDAQGALMRPMAMSLPDEQAMKDAIAHIMTLAR
jgi:cytochrome c553